MYVFSVGSGHAHTWLVQVANTYLSQSLSQPTIFLRSVTLSIPPLLLLEVRICSVMCSPFIPQVGLAAIRGPKLFPLYPVPRQANCCVYIFVNEVTEDRFLCWLDAI